MANGWNGPAPPGVVFHYRPGRSGAHAEEILAGFDGTIQVDAYGGYDRLARKTRTGGAPLTLAFCWSHGRRKLIAARPKAGSPIVDEALRRIARHFPRTDGGQWLILQDRGRHPRQDPRSPPRGPAGAVPSAGRRLLRLALRPGGPGVAQIRSRQGHGLHAQAPGRLPAVPRGQPRRHGLQPGRERHPQPGDEAFIVPPFFKCLETWRVGSPDQSDTGGLFVSVRC